MKLEVVPNKGPASMGPELANRLAETVSMDVASAFVTTASLERIEEALAQAKAENRPLRIRLLCGLYQRFTSAASIAKAMLLEKKYPGQFHVRIARNSRFHWKLYLSSGSDKCYAYVGSANFTEEGLTASGELSVKIAARATEKVIRLLQGEFNDLWTKERNSFSPISKFLKAYRKLKRPSAIVRQPGNNSILQILQRAERSTLSNRRKRKLPIGRAHDFRIRLVVVTDTLQPETIRLIKKRTNWDRLNWDYTCFRKWAYEPAKKADAMLYVQFYGEGPGAKVTLDSHRIEEWAEIDTPDGKYFIAHNHILYSRTRDYRKIKNELRKVGFTWKKLQRDRYLTKDQVKEFCILLGISYARLVEVAAE